MTTFLKPFRALAACLLFGAPLCAARAQSFTLVHSFPSDGGSPYAGLTAGPDGRLYGASAGGGLWGRGSIYVLAPEEGGSFSIDTLYSFTGGFDGANPKATLILASDGNFYGTTLDGDPLLSPGGTVFRVDMSGNLDTLHAFFGFGDGYNPAGSLMQASDGNIYGVTSAAPNGSVFRIDPEGTFTTLHLFEGGSAGANPVGPLVEGPGGLLYGVTSSWGAFPGNGTLYRVSFGGVFETLHAFGPDGLRPIAGLVLGPDGRLWGPAQGPNGGSTIFRAQLTGQVETFPLPDGWNPAAPLTFAADGDLFGTTPERVFRRDGQGNFWTTWGFIADANGFNLQGPVLQGADGLLYGTTVQGIGASALGSVFRVATDGDAFESLAGFGSARARNPVGPLLQGSDGRLYGTAIGPWDVGSLFRIDPDGTATTLHIFDGIDGAFPNGLVRTPGGRIFGSTSMGGSQNVGVAFEVDEAGVLTPFHDFTSAEGVFPQGLTLARDGSLWGAMSGPPQVFRLGPAGEFVPVHEVEGGPFGLLEEVADGSFVGAAYEGGTTGLGTLFRVDATSEYATLHTFSGWEGSHPSGAPVLGPDGNLYGLTTAGGAFGLGTLYRLSPAGRVTKLHDFSGVDGRAPVARLVVGGDGYLYGSTRFGGALELGNLFRADASGTIVSIHAFDGSDGREPESPMVQGVDGGLYGATNLGGLFGGGAVFRIEPAPALSVWTVTPSSGPAFGGTPIVVTGFGFSSLSSVTIGDWAAGAVVLENSNEISAVTPIVGLAPGTLNAIAVTNFDGRHGELADAWFADFLDVPSHDIFHDAVETVFREGITAGCGEGLYCRNDPVRRDQMAVFLLLGEHGSGYAPPACIGVFGDVPCPGPFTNWVEQLAAEGITAGCGGGNYCPAASVTRAQMTVLLLKTKNGAAYAPAPCAGIFEDAACPGAFTDWIEQLYLDEVTGGCQTAPLLYCPDGLATRGQMAVFVVRVFSLP